MKRMEALMVAVVLGWCAAPSTSVPLIPGWEEDPVKYTLELYIICDYYCFTSFSTVDESAARNTIINAVNKASRSMSQLNIELVISGLEVWNKYSWTNWTTPVEQMLPQFNWLGSQINHYLNKTYFDELVLFSGISLGVGSDVEGVNDQGCISNSRCKGIFTASQRSSVNSMASVIAHELGHALGMNHDSSGCGCPNGDSGCIMSASANKAKLDRPTYSDCSMTAFKTFVKSARSIALRRPLPPADAMIGRPTCGNGIIDKGEQCDCGPACLPVGCCNCCKDCQLVKNAQCASGKCCKTATCKFKSAGILCRNRRDSFCDEDDFCSGNSSECENSHLADWTDCLDFNNETGYCKEGFCNTINVQCRFAWDRDYKAANESCSLNNSDSKYVKKDPKYNEYSIEAKPTTRESNDLRCKTLICEGDGKNDGLPTGRSPQRRKTSSGAECLTGNYLQVESSLLGLSGTMMVEDGTMCGPDSACFAGECICKADAIRQMKNKPAFLRKTEFCGNGRLDPGEECDCGSEQCDCCDIVTCKFMGEKTPCLGSCGLCTGTSSRCPTSVNQRGSYISDFKQCGGNFNSMCYNGTCINLDKNCRNHFMFAASAKFYQSKNVGKATNLYNSGGFFVVDATNGFNLYEEYRAGEDDGVCGLVQCKTLDTRGYYAAPTDNKVSYSVRSYQLDNDKDVRILYYQPRPNEEMAIPNKGNKTVKIYYPLLTMNGIPCKLPKNVDGYCRTLEAQSTGIPSITYYYSKCIEIPTTYRNSRYQFYPFN